MELASRIGIAFLSGLLLAACSSESASPDGPGNGGLDGGSQNPDGSLRDPDGGNVIPDGGIAPSGDPPLPISPSIPDKECVIDRAAFGIASDGTSPDATTDGINQAIRTLSQRGCGRIELPAGRYAIGKKASDAYTAGIELPSQVAFVMEDETILELRPTDTWAYCVISVSRAHDVAIIGGQIRGDRHVHDFKVEGEEGHCICVQDESERVSIENVKLSQAIGDGVLIVAQGEKKSSCKDVSIRNSEIFDNRRQGISIVGGVRVLIENNHIHHIQGTAPQFGIDIESLSYESRDITIRNNRFSHNRGGDFVNTDGRNVLFEGNTMEDGEGNTYVDGPVIYWSNTDQVIRNNEIYMARGSANGKMGILEYSHKAERTNPARNLIEGNTLRECSINLMDDSLVTIRNNVVRGPSAAYILSRMSGVELIDNVLEKDGKSYSYMILETSGTASGNILNGEPFDIPMTPDEPFSNWDGQ